MPTIELSMIVKNGGAALRRCLESARSYVDRISVGDTGSTDASRENARCFGAEVIEVRWEQDFAQARNRVLERAECDWILVLDADEMLDTWSGRRIRELVQGPIGAQVGAFENGCWNYVRDLNQRMGERLARRNPGVLDAARGYPAYVLTATTRLFRRRPGVYYEGCVEETIVGRLKALDLTLPTADFVVHHFGMAEGGAREGQKKSEKGEKKVREADAPTLFRLGLGELEDFRRPEAALEYFEQACGADEHYAAAWLSAGVCLIRLGRLEDARERLERAGELGLRSGVYYQALGDVHFHAERFAEARGAYEQLERMGEASPASQAKLGAAEVRLGDVEGGIRRMQGAVESAPGFAELYDILAAGALLGGRAELAAQTAEARLSVGQPEPCHYELAAALRARLGDRKKAQSILERARV
ncbi:MAG: glycosyltransferase [Acidobacteriaceae bacterium]